MNCLVCGKKSKSHFCTECRNNPFRVEELRQILAARGNIDELKRMYDKSLPEILNLNTNVFWNDRIDKSMDHIPARGMTAERIKVAYDFMPKKAKKILDIGAGYGYIEKLISKNKKIEIYGNDISENAIKNLRKRFKGTFRLESLYKMKYDSNSFDIVFMLEVLEHVPPSKTFKILNSIKKFLKRNGNLIISIPTNERLESMKENPNGHVRLYTKDLITAELQIAGFKVVKIKTLIAFQNMYAFKKLVAKVLVNKWSPNDIIVVAKSI